MTTDTADLASPIDALYVIHHALRTEAARTEQAVTHLEIGGSFKAFQAVFYHWALTLSTYIEAADSTLTTRCPEMVRPWEHVMETAGQLLERLEALQAYVHTEIGKTIVIARTKRQLFGRVALARLLQEDLIEAEEAHLLPVLRTQLSETRQLEIMRLLLLDQDPTSQDTVIAWIMQDVSDAERQALAALTTRLAPAAGA